MKSPSPLNLCLDYLKQGNPEAAVQLLFERPESSLDRLPSSHRDLANYLDALCFGYINDALIANQVLQQARWVEPQLRQKLEEEECQLQVLRRFDDQLPEFLASSRPRRMDQQQLEALLRERKKQIQTETSLPPTLQFGQQISRLYHEKPDLLPLLSENDLFFSRPFVPLAYQGSDEEHQAVCRKIAKAKGSLILVMEQWNWDWSKLWENVGERSVILAFPSIATLMQCCQFPELLTALGKTQHTVLVLTHYPNKQLAVQNWKPQDTQDFSLINLSAKAPYKAHNTELLKNLSAVLKQEESALKSDSQEADRLYRLGRNLNDSWQAERIGESRFLALQSLRKNRDWSDSHKGRLDDELGQSERLKTGLGKILQSLAPVYPRRTYVAGKGKIRLAHVMPQLVREGHAPTKLIRTLLKNHSKETFDLTLFCTERLVFRPQEYPYDPYGSAPSVARAGEILKEIQDSGVRVFVDDARLNYQQTAHRLADSLAKLGIDIVVCHGPDMINTLASRYTNAPLRVLFEHGSLPQFPGFELAIASSRESEARLKDHFAEMGTEIRALPFCYDASSQWESTLTDLCQYGIPQGSQVMTTISNNLEARVAGEMAAAISQILIRCPKAYYAPIGYIGDSESFKKRFDPQVQSRICVLGEQANPSQLARSMQLYLNEFPFGSGLAILDAMAGGCPVVSMHYPDGPPQGRYGAVFMGMDRVVTSCKPSDYVDLTCQLLEDEITYRSWSEHASKRYQEQADPVAYVRELEALLLRKLQEEQTVSHVST